MLLCIEWILVVDWLVLVGEGCNPARQMLVVDVPDEWICYVVWMRSEMNEW